MDRLPVAILQEILCRAACRFHCSGYKDFGYGGLEEKLSSCVKPSEKWPQVTELCRLQIVSKHFQEVASTLQTLHCRISPLHAKRDLRGLIAFLATARCAKALVVTFRYRWKDEKLDRVIDWSFSQREGADRHLQSLLGLFNDLSESLEQLFPQTPCLETFAVAWNALIAKPDKISPERADELGANLTNRIFKGLAASCPQLRTLALNDGHLCRYDSLHFLCLAASSGLETVCKPFVELRRLIVQESAREIQAISTLISMCPKLQQLDIKEVYRFGSGYPKVVPGCLLLQSASLEVLDVWVPSGDVMLDIRTPKLHKLALRNRAEGVTAIAAPNLRYLEIDGSSKVEVSTQWKLGKLVVKAEQDNRCRWDLSDALQEAFQSCCSSLKFVTFDTDMAVVGKVSGFLKRLEQLEELRLSSGTWIDTCRSIAEPAKLPTLKNLTIFFKSTRSGNCSASESNVIEVVRSVTVEAFPALRRLTLEAAGSFSSRSVRALFALHKERPELELVF